MESVLRNITFLLLFLGSVGVLRADNFNSTPSSKSKSEITEEPSSHEYRIALYNPYCAGKNFRPAITGDFNDWQITNMLEITDDKARTYYVTTINDVEGHKFNFCEANDKNNRLEYFDEKTWTWKPLDDIVLPGGETKQTLNFYFNDSKYRYTLCGKETYDILVTVIVPDGAPEAGVEVLGSFGNWDEHAVKMVSQGNNTYVAGITAKETDEFKFREAGTWDNEIIYVEGGKAMSNLLISDYLAEENNLKVVFLDLSSPEVFAWKKPSTPAYYTLTLLVSDEKMGTVSGGGKFAAGTPVKIHATANKDYQFIGWSDGEKDAFRTVTMDDDITLTANFEPLPDSQDQTVKVRFAVAGWSSVYAYAWEMIDGKANILSEKKTWPGDDITSTLDDGFYSFDLKKGANIIFSQKGNPQTTDLENITEDVCYVWRNGNAVVDKNCEGVACPEIENDLTVTICEGEEYNGHTKAGPYSDIFTADNGCDSIVNLTLIVTKPLTIEAYSNNDDYGKTVVVQQPDCKNGNTAIVNAIAYEGYRFVQWSDGNRQPRRQLQLTDNLSLEAIFEEAKVVYYTLSISTDNEQMGQVSATDVYTTSGNVTSYTDSYEDGLIVTIEALPFEGYQFVGWSDGEKDARRNIPIHSDTAFVAYFDYAVLTIAWLDADGSLLSTSETDYGMLPTYTASTPIREIDGKMYIFSGWNPKLKPATQNAAYTATYQPLVMTESMAAMGVFSVGEGKSVRFAKGNVIYSVATDSWLTAPAQYAVAGDVNINLGNPDYSGFIDLFAWSCESAKFGVNPSNDDNHYTGDFVDWGSNFNGNWRTLSADEWQYLLSGRPNASQLWANASVVDRKGLLLLPDKWVKPEGIEFTPAYKPADSYEEDFTANKYNYAQWQALELSGALFLPAAGSRTGGYGNTMNGSQPATFVNEQTGFYSWVDNVDAYGYYWSSTAVEEKQTMASYLIFGGDMHAYTYGNAVLWNREKRRGNSVRLATDVIAYRVAWLNYDGTLLEIDEELAPGARPEYNGPTPTHPDDDEATYIFYGWSPELRPVEGNTLYTAVFERRQLTHFRLMLDVNSAEQGKIRVDDQEPVTSLEKVYKAGEQVKIEAVAEQGYHFIRWSDGVTQQQRTITLTSSIRLTAVFAPDTKKYTLTVLSNNSEWGSATGSGNFDKGEQASIEAIPAEGYRFIGWSDGNKETQRTITIKQNTTLYANFEKIINYYNLTLLASDENLGYTAGSGTYAEGFTVTINAFPTSGNKFVGWSDGNNEARRTITINGDITLTANFEPIPQEVKTYKLTLLSNGNMGSVTGGGDYEKGTQVEIEALPFDGYWFVGWSDGDIRQQRTIVLISDITLTAIFDPLPPQFTTYSVTLTTNSEQMGETYGSGNYAEGSKILISAVANKGYRFVNWSDGNTNEKRTITVNQDVVLTANFEKVNIIYTLSLFAGDAVMGTVRGAGQYDEGTQVTIEAIPYHGYRFVEWSDGVAMPTRNIVVDRNITLTAYFETTATPPPPLSYRLTLSVNNTAMGVVTGEGIYAKDTEVEIEAIPNDGYQFVKWSDENAQPARTITLSSNLHLIAFFSPLPAENVYYTLTVVSADIMKGAIAGTGEYQQGTYAEAQAIPFEHFVFRAWDDGNAANPRQVLMDGNKHLTAVFVGEKHQLTLTCNTMHGRVSGAGSYEYDTEVTVEAFPREHYTFLNWSDGIGDNPRQLYIDQDITLEALFVPDPTAVEDVNSGQTLESKPRKVIIGGHLYIIMPDGKIYDSTGKQL